MKLNYKYVSIALLLVTIVDIYVTDRIVVNAVRERNEAVTLANLLLAKMSEEDIPLSEFESIIASDLINDLNED